MINKYIKPRMKTLYDSVRNMQPTVNDKLFYSNGYYAVKMDLVADYYPTLYGKIVSNKKEVYKPDLQKLVDGLDQNTYVELKVADIVEIKPLQAPTAFLTFDALGLRIPINAELVSFFQGMHTKKVSMTNYHRPISFWGRTNDKAVLVKSSDEVVGVIMPIREA